jgi:hypothetical protein
MNPWILVIEDDPGGPEAQMSLTEMDLMRLVGQVPATRGKAMPSINSF